MRLRRVTPGTLPLDHFHKYGVQSGSYEEQLFLTEKLRLVSLGG
jgi:hypothetical protein